MNANMDNKTTIKDTNIDKTSNNKETIEMGTET